MDVVYLVRPGNRNEELRWSLRTLVNLPHDRVWIVGHLPNWIDRHKVQYLRTEQYELKHANTLNNLATACDHSDISDRFVLMNDDFFVLQPVDQLPVLHCGPVDEWIASRSDTSYRLRAIRTRDLLVELGYDGSRLLFYELHVPMPVDRAVMMEAIKLMRGQRKPWTYNKRTLYGNLAGIGGERTTDCKIMDDAKWDRLGGAATVEQWRFLSTIDGSFKYGKLGRWLRARFPDRSPYER